MKLLKLLSLGLIILFMNFSFANDLLDDTVKLTIGTQTYHCEINPDLNCTPINQLEQKKIALKKNGGTTGAEDKARKLSVDVATSLNGDNVVYGMTTCSSQACTLTSTSTDPDGKINQILSGVYNITSKSFDILGFFIVNDGNNINLQESVLNKSIYEFALRKK